ncbi:MAG TPA: cyanophycin synthetase, partial [Thermoanaerobaculia bacterium]|nr:cyanophycin synthetase [Thermoanaerobaculia bacterium]
AALQAAARASGARLELAVEAVEVIAAQGGGLAGQTLTVRTAVAEYAVRVALAGRHQQRNVALAIAAAERLADDGFDDIDEEAIVRGVGGCRWPGRLEAVALPEGPTVLLDGAHNPAGAAALAEHLASLATPWDLVFGTLADKDAAGMAAALAPGARCVWLAPPDSSRALPLAELAALPSLAGAIPVGDLGDALTRALEDAAPLLVVSGSLYLVGSARRWLRERYGVPVAAADVATWSPP